MEVHSGADIHTAAHGRQHARGGCAVRETDTKNSPQWSRFSGRTCDPVRDSHWSSLFLKDCTPWEGPMLEQFVKNCNLWEGPNAGAGEQCEEEGVAETKCYGLTATPVACPPCIARGKEVEMSGEKFSLGRKEEWREGHGDQEVIPEDWKNKNFILIFKKGKKEYLGNYRPVNLTLIYGMVMEQILMDTISKHIKDRRMPESSKHGFMKRKSCLINLIAFYNEMTSLVDEWKAVNANLELQ
ncbi:mitochondrial enolase superfamily member 1 [Grus japonensis]|uniref:Mitochondrial enolase superfamily member 1 n=1 Tax=Grus japonensis TaxID=30415 RepID=A0ABC9W874_GRUJA